MGQTRLIALAVVAVAVATIDAAARQPETPLNQTCPVMQGEPVDPDMVVEYQGKRVWLCCSKCKVKFERNPTAYLAGLAGLPQFAATNAAVSPGGGVEGEQIPVLQQANPELIDAINKAIADAGEPVPAAPTPEPAPVADPAAEARDPEVAAADFLGRLHPVAVHFPIALLLTAAFLELIGLFSRAARAREMARVCLILGAVGAAVAAGLGWINAAFNPYTGELATTLWLHRWMGIAVAAGAAVCVILMALGDRTRGLYRLVLFASAALVAVTGYFGGDLVRGPNHLFAGLGGGAGGAGGGGAPAVADPGVRGAAPRSPPVSDPLAVAGTGQAALDRLLFASNNEEAFVARRDIRLARVTPPGVVVHGAADHPIDHFVREKWREAGLPEASSPPALCDDSAFVRRVYLDIIGVIPTIEEAERFLSGTDPDKRAALIDELLARDDDYAAHWTPFWEDALGSSNVALQGGVPTRGNYRQWIYDSFRTGTPFDVLAAELIDPSMPGHKAAVGADANGKVSRIAYIRSETHVDTMQSAANVAQVFLGTGMKCASCHSHFENEEWPQQRFLAFAGMFAGRDLELIRCEARTGEVVKAAFPFEIPGMPADVPADEEGRLRRAAQLLTDPLNPRFAKAIVNRLWKRYLGLGLFEPVDDFRLERAPSHPELLDWLAYDFMTHGYDLKRTIRLILTSRTYQTRYDAALADSFDVGRPDEPRYFRSPTLRRLTAEQLLDSVRVATTQRLDPPARLYLDTTSTALTRSLGKPASRNEISTGRPDDVAIVQALDLLNGDEYHAHVYSGRLIGQSAGVEGTIDDLYRAALSRPPTDEERRLAVEYVRSALDREPGPRGPVEPREILFIDDELPEGSRVSAPDGWPWTEARAQSGRRAHGGVSHAHGTEAQHYVIGASEPIAVGAADTLFVHVWIDPADPPREIMIQWNDGGGDGGGWSHRAYWGEDLIEFGMADSPGRHPMGPMPKVGEWVRLEIPGAAVGFGRASRISGMSFDQVGGSVTWDRSGVVDAAEEPADTALGDLLWVLFTSPEFQYAR